MENDLIAIAIIIGYIWIFVIGARLKRSNVLAEHQIVLLDKIINNLKQ